MPIYMHIAGLPGTSTTKGFEQWHRISSFSWGCSTPSGMGKVSFTSLNVTMNPSRSAPGMMLQVANGRFSDRAILAITDSMNRNLERIQLYDVQLSSFSQGYSDGETGMPSVALSLVFKKINFRVYLQRKDGAEYWEEEGWDLAAGTGI